MHTEFLVRNLFESSHLEDQEGLDYNIKMYHREICCQDMKWIKLDQDHIQWWY
jgi:hypothetical protein